MDIGTASTATATLAFAFSTTTSTTRQWEVKVTQIKCFGRERQKSIFDKKYYEYLKCNYISNMYLATFSDPQIQAVYNTIQEQQEELKHLIFKLILNIL